MWSTKRHSTIIEHHKLTFLQVEKINVGNGGLYYTLSGTLSLNYYAGMKNKSMRLSLLTADRVTQELRPHSESLSGLPPSRPHPSWHLPLPVSSAAPAETPGAAFGQLSSLHSHQRNFWTFQPKQLWNSKFCMKSILTRWFNGNSCENKST